MIIAPNFSGIPNLEELDLARCSNLRKLHPSIGKLKKLKLLDLYCCRNLTGLPNEFEMESLVTLNLSYCLNLKRIPEFVGNMMLLQNLRLEGTAIMELPSSIECLTGLNVLSLTHCRVLVCLPNTICSLTSLNNINLWGCFKFDKLPEDLRNITSLKDLNLSHTGIKELPSSVEFLIGLTSLHLHNCKNFVVLPSTICSLKSLEEIDLWGCLKFDKLPEDLGNITSLKRLNLKETAIKELPSSVEFLIGLTLLSLEDCKSFVHLPSTVCNLKSLDTICLSGCSKIDNLPENLGNLECLQQEPRFGGAARWDAGHLKWDSGLFFGGTAIEVLPSSIGRLAALEEVNLKNCKNLMCLPSTICNLKWLHRLILTGCSKIANLPENLGNITRLRELFLGGTAIRELPSSMIHHERLHTVCFRGCQLSSSSLTYMPVSYRIDLSDCNLLAIPSGIDRISKTKLKYLFLSGNDFVSLPESISQFSSLRSLYLDGCKSLRSLSNIQIPSKVSLICVDNCTSLERLPEPPNDFCWSSSAAIFDVQCFNCFKLADNIQNFSNMFQVSLSPICVF